MSYPHASTNAYLVKAYSTRPAGQGETRQTGEGFGGENQNERSHRGFSSEEFHRKISARYDVDSGDAM